MEYRGLTLDPFQEQAIGALHAGHSVLVSAPTGTGKTIIADWIVEEALRSGKQVIYTAPIKALSNQKFRDYTRLYGEENVGLVTGDLVIRRDAPCLVMTTEILRNMLLAGEALENLLAVILDEIHFLDDRERGTVWEEVLIYLPSRVQVVGLSATLSNLRDFAAWLEHVRGSRVEVVVEERRAVPLTFSYFSVDSGLTDPREFQRIYRRKRGRMQKERGRDRRGRRPRRGRPPRRTGHLDVFRAMRDHELMPYLYFVFSRRDTEICARSLGRNLDRPLLDEEEQERAEAYLRQVAPELGSALDDELRELYAKGVAFHHAGLHVQLKGVVEELYEQRLIKVLYCTSTFALGINMPSRAVVFDGLKKFDGQQISPLTTRQFMQKAGRAGRRGMDEAGEVVVRLDLEEYPELQPLLERYARGAYEPVRSSFNLSWNSIVNLLASYDEEHIRTILDRSFLSWHLSRSAERHQRQAEQMQPETRKQKQQANRLRMRAARAESRVWDEYRAKVGYLVAIGYLGEDLSFHAGAKVLRHLQIAEVLVAELVLSGVLEDLSPARLFGVLCGLTNELPRHVHRNFRPRGEDRALAREVKQIRWSDAVVGAEELGGTPYSWDPDLLHLGRAWAEGEDLQELLMMVSSETDISGDLITGFRRAKDLAGQLLDVYRDLPDRVAMLRELIRTVSRDEVEVVG